MRDKILNPKTIDEIKEELAPIKAQLCEILVKIAHDLKFHKAQYKSDDYNPNPEQLVQCLKKSDSIHARVFRNYNGHDYSLFIGIQHVPEAGILYFELTPKQARLLQDSLTDADYRTFCEHSLSELIDDLRNRNKMILEFSVDKARIALQELLWELQSIPSDTNFKEFCPLMFIEETSK